MKKIFTLLALVLFLNFAFGQALDIMNTNDNGIRFDKSKIQTPCSKSSKSSTERWYNYGETMDLFHGETSELYGNNLFPDTTILVDYGTSGYSGPWIHAIGDMLDVKSIFFNDPFLHPGELALNAQSTYRLDSVGVLCIYERNMADPNVVDTLVIEVAVNHNFTTAYFSTSTGNIPANLGTDTVFIKRVDYSYTTNALGIATKKTYKFPLTQQFWEDSLDWGGHYIEVATPDVPVVVAGSFVFASVSFIPGYTWNANVDTLTQKNRLFFLTYKEQDGMFPIYNKKDYNISYLIPQDVRYNVAGSWNGLYIPSFAYMGSGPTYNYEHHLIYYKVVCETGCGVAGIEPTNQAVNSMGDAYPNPQNLGETIYIPLQNTTSNSKLYIRNILGQNLIQIDQITTGNQVIEVNTSQLPSGVYLYTLESENQHITKKFSIQK
ncbi:MAG: T9SS type A sorting domain-containing protein [Bacteroidales bacterium]|nr:T9SS type A sorting domain-containing protein [Bacteroidales bacterium]